MTCLYLSWDQCTMSILFTAITNCLMPIDLEEHNNRSRSVFVCPSSSFTVVAQQHKDVNRDLPNQDQMFFGLTTTYKTRCKFILSCGHDQQSHVRLTGTTDHVWYEIFVACTIKRTTEQQNNKEQKKRNIETHCPIVCVSYFLQPVNKDQTINTSSNTFFPHFFSYPVHPTTPLDGWVD